MSKFHTLTIQKITKETEDAVSILFDVPANLKDEFSFKAGQYITLKTIINGNEVRRAYSICESPNSNELKVAVKAVENGVFSSFATSSLKSGDSLDVFVPEGQFILSPEANKNYIAFAAGSGITPVLSMIKTVLKNENSSTFTLVYGNKTAEKTIFKKQLDTLLEQYPNTFKLHYVFSQENNVASQFGRIDKGITNYFIKNIHKEIAFDAAFLCGPEEMINIVSETLKENNFSENTIHFELFTASKEENDIEVRSEEHTSELQSHHDLVCRLLLE